MRAGEDADGVQLDGAEPPEHGRHAAPAGVGADEPLRAQGDDARFVLAQGELRRRQRGTGHDTEATGSHRQASVVRVAMFRLPCREAAADNVIAGSCADEAAFADDVHYRRLPRNGYARPNF